MYSIEKKEKEREESFLYKDSKNSLSPPSPPSLGVEMVARTHSYTIPASHTRAPLPYLPAANSPPEKFFNFPSLFLLRKVLQFNFPLSLPPKKFFKSEGCGVWEDKNEISLYKSLPSLFFSIFPIKYKIDLTPLTPLTIVIE